MKEAEEREGGRDRGGVYTDLLERGGRVLYGTLVVRRRNRSEQRWTAVEIMKKMKCLYHTKRHCQNKYSIYPTSVLNTKKSPHLNVT